MGGSTVVQSCTLTKKLNDDGFLIKGAYNILSK